MNSPYKQWDILLFKGYYAPYRAYTGLVVNHEGTKILWDNGNLTESIGPAIIFHSHITNDKFFDIEKAFENSIGNFKIDNLDYIEIVDNYKTYLNEHHSRIS